MTSTSLLPDLARIDRLMEAHGLDVLIATSKHNTQYMLGGYRFISFAAMDAGEHANHPFWTPRVLPAAWGSADAAALAVAQLRKIGAEGLRVGIEPSFLPVRMPGRF